MTQAERLYYRDDPGEVLLRPLEGLTLIYHRPSGMTHIVDSPVPEILAVLSPEPRPARLLLEILAAGYDLEGEGEALDTLVGYLEELCALGLARAR